MGPELEKYAIVLIPTCMWFSAQIIKFILYSIRHGVHWKYLFEYGHMPSSHTACMTSLFFTVSYYEGLDSPIFAVAFMIGLLTIYDAVKLRTYIGDYGKTINQMNKDAGLGYPRLKERVGHTTTEVLTGAALGVLGSLLLIFVFKAL